MKYVILIHSNPDPWGHPTSAYTAEGRAVSQAEHERMDAEFDAMLEALGAAGELVFGEALGDPVSSRIFGWPPDGHVATDGPFAEAKEHLGGYLIVDCESPERAAEIAVRWPSARFSPLEVRPLMDAAGAEM